MFYTAVVLVQLFFYLFHGMLQVNGTLCSILLEFYFLLIIFKSGVYEKPRKGRLVECIGTIRLWFDNISNALIQFTTHSHRFCSSCA